MPIIYDEKIPFVLIIYNCLPSIIGVASISLKLNSCESIILLLILSDQSILPFSIFKIANDPVENPATNILSFETILALPYKLVFLLLKLLCQKWENP